VADIIKRSCRSAEGGIRVGREPSTSSPLLTVCRPQKCPTEGEGKSTIVCPSPSPALAARRSTASLVLIDRARVLLGELGW
jgi:hypothetical protein